MHGDYEDSQKSVRQTPDVTGFTLYDALELLGDKKADRITLITTRPPKMKELDYDGRSRVVRQREIKDGALELLVSNMDKIKKGQE